MSRTMPPRGPVTDLLVDHLQSNQELAAKGILVGDNTRPPAAGWSGTQPGQGQFTASVEVGTGEGVPNPAGREPVGSRHSSWSFVYGLGVVGATRTQADHAADAVRAAVLELGRGAIPGLDGWRLTEVFFTRQAPVRKQDPTDIPTFAIDDVVQLWLERSRS